jgi:hypothetical protein
MDVCMCFAVPVGKKQRKMLFFSVLCYIEEQICSMNPEFILIPQQSRSKHFHAQGLTELIHETQSSS